LQRPLGDLPAVRLRIGEIEENFEDLDPRKPVVIGLRQQGD